MDKLLKELNEFLGKAAPATYAGGGPGVDPEKAEKGMKELEYGDKNGEWYYKDSYGGFFQSWGREVVWHDGKPFWVQIYGGGMEPEFFDNLEFTHSTFDFLKKALSAGEKLSAFQPRGPKSFSEGEWSYECDWHGDITKFEGNEIIR
ncbi:MAG: hypothetical protein KKE05_00350, partial [Nanoarchaeota archaeon]|nr:hypothetical protein [Nanoarchaeota archaeon]